MRIPRLERLSIVVPAGGSLTATLVIPEGARLVAIVMPSAWTAANLTFRGSYDGGTTYTDVYDAAGNERTVTAAASRYITLNQADWPGGIDHMRLRSGTAGVPVNQASARTVGLIFMVA